MKTPKTKKQILAMSKEELSNYKWSDDLDIEKKKKDTNKNCNSCYSCYSCNFCNFCDSCKNLVNGLYCRNLKLEKKDYDKYYICNVEVTKKELEKKKKEIDLK